MTNDKYREQGLALVQKVPTPITPVNINDKGQITLAYFDSKSTVDYIIHFNLNNPHTVILY